MSFVRHITLINSAGDEYDVTTTEALLIDPKGLGFKRKTDYRRVGNRFFLLSKQREQVNFQGKVIFTPPGAYIKYHEFMEFIVKEPLKIRYNPIDHFEYYQLRGKMIEHGFNYYADVMINEIQKEELTKYGTLDVPITLTPITPWYRTIGANSSVNDFSGLIWEMTSNWSFTFEEGSGKSVRIDSDSHMDSPCRLLIPGPAVNPSWKHYVNGKKVATGSVKCTIPYNYWLSVDNTGESNSIKILDSSLREVSDVYQDSDFSTKRFLEIQNGNNAVYVDFDDGNDYDIRLEVNLYYESV